METKPHSPSRTIWIGLLLLAVILGLCVFVVQRQSLPLPVLGQVADFTLTNQFGHPVKLAELRGKVWLADIIFTRCPGPCARMTRQMAEVQAGLSGGSAARLISLTTDPEFDTPTVLQQYATKYGADGARWQFLTGTKVGIAGLAIDSLKLAAVENPPEHRTNADDLFIHSTMFILVDKQARLRGIYKTGGEDVPWEAVKPEIFTAIQQLERER